MRFLINITFGLVLILGSINGTPCPKIFTYHKSPFGEAYGYVRIPNLWTAGSVAQIAVRLSTAKHLGSVTGHISLLRSDEDTMTAIASGREAEFTVTFPSQSPIPLVESISVNGLEICSGPSANGFVVTRSNLFFTLHIWTPRGMPSRPTGTMNNDGVSVYRSSSSRRTEDGTGVYYESSYNFTSFSGIDNSDEHEDENFEVTNEQPNIREYPVKNSTIPSKPLRTTSTTTTTTTTKKPTTQTVKQYSCGLPVMSRLQSHSIGGLDAARGRFPWMAPLFDQDDVDDPKFICGSSIINKQYLITAAHCVVDNLDQFLPPERILAIPGMHNIDDFLDENSVFATVKTITIHNGYVPDDLNDADVALIRLKDELKFTDYIIPVCIWNLENNLDKVVGNEALTAGWGLTENGQTKTPTFITSFIVSRLDCNQNLERSYPYNAKIFCADGRGSVPCRGDSGSGLVIKRGNQYFLRGVVSKGLLDRNTLKCDTTKHAVYTDIAKFRTWMKNNMLN